MTTAARIGISTNLPEGGTHDLLLIKFVDSFPEGRISFDIDNTPRKITGIQKVAQLFLKILLTSKGSNLLRPAEGTQFAEYTIHANRTGVDSELYAIITSEIKSAENQVKYILNNPSNKDLASQLYEIKVLGINIQDESVTMFIKITTMAGESAQVAYPFPLLDLPLSDG